jgi:uncharacterized protein (DUF1697 family)
VDVVTYIQSGNVVFDTGEIDQTKIIKLIEEGLTRSLGGDVRVILRDKRNIKKILESNPFLNQRNLDPNKLYVTFLCEAATGLGVPNLPLPNNNGDEFMIYDKEVYLFCPNGYGKTKFTNTFFEKKLRVSATTRNWKTVHALYEIAELR